MTLFLQLPPPREAQQVAAFMRGRHHRRQRCLPSLFRLCPSFGRDRNYRRRTLRILALATDNTAADRDMAADIRHYLAQKDSHFRSRTDYLAHFAARHLPLYLKALRESLT